MPRTFKTWFEENHPGVNIPGGDIPASWFSDNELPMIVRCSCCDTTMIVFSAIIDDDDYVYCSNCLDPES